MSIQKNLMGLILFATSGCVMAQPGSGHGAPYELLATAPGITIAQQQEIRRIESERRDAHDSLRIKQRGEHARIDEQAEQRLRHALTDDGYQRYIEWKSTRFDQRSDGRHNRRDSDPNSEHGKRSDRLRAPPAPPAPEAKP